MFDAVELKMYTLDGVRMLTFYGEDGYQGLYYYDYMFIGKDLVELSALENFVDKYTGEETQVRANCWCSAEIGIIDKKEKMISYIRDHYSLVRAYWLDGMVELEFDDGDDQVLFDIQKCDTEIKKHLKINISVEFKEG